ncbi:MAG: phage major capsid protein [Pseudomonadota bacterium]
MDKETKSGGETYEIRQAMQDFLGAFEAFKESNDERLRQLETRTGEDVVTCEKVDRINRAVDEQKQAIDRLALAARRPGLGGETASGAPNEHRAAFNAYMRAGDASRLRAVEEKALSVGSDPDGGYLAPEETERAVMERVKDVSPVRQIASVRQIGASMLRKPISTTGTAGGWVAEAAARTETTTSTLAVVDFPTMELYAMPAATQSLLDDSIVDIEQWLASEIQTEFAVQESDAFVNGNGTTQPAGILNYTKVAEASHAWGQLGYVATGVDADFAGSNPTDILIDLIYTPKQAFRANGRFLMNRSVAGALRKFKDAEGNYLWQPGLVAGQPSTLLGFPVTESEDMPAIGSDSYSIAFGDFERGYLIVDRVGLRILRDPFSSKPHVLFYTTKRVGGGVQDFDAIKLLKFGVS